MHRAHVAGAVGHAAAHQAAARGLQHGGVDGRVVQDHLRRDRAGHVALHRQVAVDVDAVGAGEPDPVAGELHDVGHHARGGGLAVGAGDGADRDARLAAGREQHVHHRAGDVARRALARRDVHAEAGRGVDLADAAADVLVGLGDVGGEEVDAADVEADGADGADRHLAVVGVDDVGDVDRGAAGREVGGGAQVDDLALGRDGVLVVALLGQHALGLVVELEPGQHLLVADAAARVLVDDLDQLLDGALAVADDVAGHALGGGDQLAVDHQQAMVEALEEALDQHGAAVLAGGGEGRLDLLLVHQADADAAAVIGVERLDHDREADAAGGRGRVLGVVDHALLGHRQAEVAQEPDGLLLVRGELDRDVRRLAGDRGLDALLEAAVAELDQALAVEPQPGDVALLGRRHQGRRARAQRLALGEADEAVAAALEVEMLGVEVGRAQLRRQQRMEQLQRRAGPPPGRPPPARTRRRRKYSPGSPVPRVLPKVTGVPATFCSSIATCSSTWPSQVPSPSCRRRTKPPGSP